MDDDLRASPAAFAETLTRGRHRMLLGGTGLRSGARTRPGAVNVGGAASYVLTADGLREHFAVVALSHGPRRYRHRRTGRLNARADFSTVPGQSSRSHAGLARIEVGLRGVRAGRSSSSLDDG